MHILARNTADQFIKIDDTDPTMGIYIDTASLMLPRAHGYRLAALDSCGEITKQTLEQRAIYLTVTPSRSNDNVTLRWTHYRGFTVNQYEVLRKSGSLLSLVGTVAYPAQEFAINEPDKDLEEIRYIVRAQAPENCGSTPFYDYTWSNYTRNLGTREVGLEAGVSVAHYAFYPNPNRGIFHIALHLEGKGALTLTLTDMQGRAVWQQQYSDAEGFMELDITLSDIAAGMYQLRIDGGNRSIMEKIQIVR
jgi:hypothetical protein